MRAITIFAVIASLASLAIAHSAIKPIQAQNDLKALQAAQKVCGYQAIAVLEKSVLECFKAL